MILANADNRRGLRAIVDALAQLLLVGLLYRLTGHLAGNAEAELGIARGALLIVGLATLFYGAENVTRAIKLSGMGLDVDISGEPAPVKVVNQPDEPVPVEGPQP